MILLHKNTSGFLFSFETAYFQGVNISIAHKKLLKNEIWTSFFRKKTYTPQLWEVYEKKLLNFAQRSVGC